MQAEDSAPPRPPLPRLYDYEETPPVVPPLPKEASVIRHTSVRGLKRQSDERKRDRESGQYVVNGDCKVGGHLITARHTRINIHSTLWMGAFLYRFSRKDLHLRGARSTSCLLFSGFRLTCDLTWVNQSCPGWATTARGRRWTTSTSQAKVCRTINVDFKMTEVDS